MTTPPSLSFEDAMRELESIVRHLESGRLSLDQAMQAYERGVALKKLCEAKLGEARLKIEQITMAADGSVSAQEIQIETTHESGF